MNPGAQPVAGSFRDPSGRVIVQDGRVLRTVMPVAAQDYAFARDTGILSDAVAAGWLIGTQEVPPPEGSALFDGAAQVLEHERVPYVSYPYEWGFEQLKAAALHHLEFHLWLLERDATLSDATAYNIQFIDARPVFIDVLSIVPYTPGQHWLGYRQFCEQFLCPLLLRACKGIAHNEWYRGALEGIRIEDLAAVLGLRDKLSLNVLTHVVVHAGLQRKARENPQKAVSRASSARKLSKSAFSGLLTNLRNWIARLRPRGKGTTTWANYADHNTYDDAEARAKAEAVAEFIRGTRPGTVMDLGCNTGDYCVVALENGAERALGFDFDQTTVDVAFDRARTQGMPFLPLWLDAANASPNLGWDQGERLGFKERAQADAVLALAFEHHLAIGRNIPLPEVVAWLVSLAPAGLIEFVPKSDPTVQLMLSTREDIFHDYSEDTFRAALEAAARITGRTVVSSTGRVMYGFAR